MELGAQFGEDVSYKSFSEEICRLVQCQNITRDKQSTTDDMTVKFNMFRLLMQNRIFGNIKRESIITIERNRTRPEKGTCISVRRCTNLAISREVKAMALYSAFIEEIGNYTLFL